MPNPSNPQSWNRYSYVNNNPLRYTDPTGHMQASDDYQDGDGKCAKADKGCNDLVRRIETKKRRKGDGTTLTSSTSLSIGAPQNLGDYLSGIWMGGGQPNIYYVGGVHVEQEGDGLYATLTGSSLQYGATYGVEFFEHGAALHISENYSLSENTVYTEVNYGAAVLNIKTSDGVAHRLALGELEVGNDRKRTTDINIFGSYPAEMNITLFINLSETLVSSAPLPNFEFFTQPSAVYP